MRGIATARPQSLAKICLDNKFEIISDLMEFVQRLFEITPQIDEPSSIVRQGLSHTETIVHCLVEIMHAFALADISQVERVTLMFIALLKNESGIISHSAKEAIILLLSPRAKRRKVAIITPPVCSTPTPPALSSATSLHRAEAATDANNEDDALDEAAGVVNTVAATGSASPPSNVQRSSSTEYVPLPSVVSNDPNVMVDPLEAFMGSGFPQLLGLQQDADDEAIMDIAIALSLQQHDAAGADPALQQLQQGLQGMRNAAVRLQHAQQRLQAVSVGSGSSAVAGSASGGSGAAALSAAGSDDEGSNVATDGSTLRTSPAEPVGSGGSESGGSGVESIGGTSGRSSTYGDGGAIASPPRASGGGSIASASSGSKGAVVGSLSTAVVTELPTTSRAALEAAHSNDIDENDATEDDKLAKLHDLR